MFKKLIPGKSNSPRKPSETHGSQEGSPTAIDAQQPLEIQHIEDPPSLGSTLDAEEATAAAEAEAAEAGQHPSSTATTPTSSPPAVPGLASHPITPNHSGYATPMQGSSPGASSASAQTSRMSAGHGSPHGPASATESPGSEFQTHLRKVTANLVDILDQMSNAGGSATSSPPGSSKDGTLPRRHTMGSRGDSVATMVDLEAQGSGAPSVDSKGGATGPVVEEMVPAHHVRRLTTTIVDMLRSMTATAGAGKDANHHGEHMTEGAGLLWDTASELSLESDKLSVSSGAPSGTGSGSSGRDSEISAATALLKAQYLPQPEYRGDEVRPFYLDRRGSRQSSSHLSGDKPDVEADVAAEQSADYIVPRKLKKKKAVNWIGLLVYIIFILVFVGYIGIRAAKTLGLGGSLWYGIVVLAIEILGGIAMLPYGLCLTMRVIQPKSAAGTAEKGAQPSPTAIGYHIRVVIPCYKEPLDVISKTFMAALYAALPPNCRRTVYLLDDGKDPDKRRFVRSLGLSNAVYISGRKRAKGEMNGKSANINNATRQIYPPGMPIPLDEVLCVFDADQVPNADFFTKTVPRLDGGQDVAMVLSPQTFYNLNPDGDIFNHANVAFWDYTQPGYDALGLISCTGTNFLLRARAFSEAGFFPEWTLTEDFALGIELKRRGWQCSYVEEYLAVGEAPEEVRNCFQQRSRWAKGHFQVFFGRGRNPAFGAGAKGLSLLMRWMYGSVVLSYFSAFFATPLLMLVPIITVWFGAFPIVINFWAAVSITGYYAATLMLMYYTRSFAHLKSMWFSSVANAILWFAFLKAMYRATIGRWLSGTIVFKVTAKGLQRLNNLPLRDVWMSTLWFVFSLITLIFGLLHFFKGGVLDTPLAISLIFMVYNLIPQYLLLQYAAFRPRLFYNFICKLAMLLSTVMMILGVVLVWVLYPKSYDYKAALGHSLYFLDTQRVGTLPADFRVTWRKSAFVDEAQTSVYLAQNPNDTLYGGFGDGFGYGPGYDPYGSFGSLGGGSSPFGSSPFSGGNSAFGNDPFSSSPSFGNDPFGRRRLLQSNLPTGSDPFASTDPFPPITPTPAVPAPTPASPPAGKTPARATTPPAPRSRVQIPPPTATTAPIDPIAGSGSASDLFPVIAPTPPGAPGSDPVSPLDPLLGNGATNDPFAPISPDLGSGGLGDFGDLGDLGNTGDEAPLATNGTWDLTGGWISGMIGGNMKATTPIAFTTALLAWGYIAFPAAYEAAGQTAAVRDSVRWGADYLAKVHRFDPETNTSLLVTRVGDVDTELMLWYRPEDGAARPAYAVDLSAATMGGMEAAVGADLGGSVAAALAAASTMFRSSQTPGDAEYAASLLNKAKEVYSAALPAKGRYTDSDYNMTLVYNSSTVYDDMAWAAGWLYKATQDDAYLGDLYDYYVKHLEAEGEISDWKYAFDWDNVFWPVNVLMAQETGKGTFKKQSELFLKNWMCANNVANYTQRGRAFNPYSGSLGSTANAAMLALMYGDIIQSENAAAAETYRCWALSQMRYMLGDAGRSMVVGVGTDSPKRTQDRSAACPPAPAVCNRVTGLLSPDPDSHKLTGALVQGPGKSDVFMDVRNNDGARVGIENNAGFTGALAGASLLPDGKWEVCLQQFGIYRSNPVCGDFVSV